MNIDDFRFMRRGKQIALLSQQQCGLLQPIDRRGPNKERALLLLHGFSSSPAVYRQMVPDLMMYDAVVCPVLTGHATSIADFAQVKRDDWLLTAKQTCEALLQEYPVVDVMGLSLGGILACMLSTQLPVHHLYLLSPALALRLKPTLSCWITAAICLRFLGIQKLTNRAGNLHTDRYSELAYRQIPLSAIIEVLRLINEYRWAPPPCTVDVFLGCYDAVVDNQWIATKFNPLSNATVHWLAESAHVLPLDGNISTILDCIKKHQYA